ncbi:DUF6082 family protein [Streptomyces antibioticus]|uniref:DUF6082 family protein n=1 Tax=Streptomyces antibioticus TaxID=1890 RepID=UPI00367AFB09
MPSVPSWYSTAKFCAAWLLTSLGIALAGVISVAVGGWLIDGAEWAEGGRKAATERSAVGDYFGGVSALFSGLALILLIATLLFQKRELRMQREDLILQRQELTASREELRRSAEADLRGLHVQLTQMAMAEPALAEVWNDVPADSPQELRQSLFANLTFSHYVLVYSWGGVTEGELLRYANSLLRSPAFQRYWEATRPSKVNLPPDSAEARVFRLFEQALSELSAAGPPGSAN